MQLDTNNQLTVTCKGAAQFQSDAISRHTPRLTGSHVSQIRCIVYDARTCFQLQQMTAGPLTLVLNMKLVLKICQMKRWNTAE